MTCAQILKIFKKKDTKCPLIVSLNNYNLIPLLFVGTFASVAQNRQCGAPAPRDGEKLATTKADDARTI